MKERLISGTIIISVVTLVLYLGGIVFDFGVSLLALGAFYELMNAKREIKIPSLMKVISLLCMYLLMFVNVDGH